MSKYLSTDVHIGSFIIYSNDFKEAFDQITADGLWTKDRVKELERAYLDLPHSDLCMTRDSGVNPQVSVINI